MDVSELLARFPKPSKGDLGVLTFSGAFCGIAHDFCEDIGVRLPPLSQETLELSHAHLAGFPAAEKSARSRDPDDPAAGTPADVRRGAVARSGHWRALAISIPATSPRHAIIYIDGIVAASKDEQQTGGACNPRGRRRHSRPSSWPSRGKTTLCCRARRTEHFARWAKSSATAIAIPHWRRAKAPRSDLCRSRSSAKARSRNGSARRCSPHSAYEYPRADLPAAPTAAVGIADRVGYPSR